jgi:hypothetical protein
MENNTNVYSANAAAKIKINCGYCGLNNGCMIRAKFKALAKGFTSESEHTFSLKCPFKTPKYTKGQLVVFTVGYGRHKEPFVWKCNIDPQDCENCKNESLCNDGLVTFQNTRYNGYVEILGEIYNYYKNGIFIIKVNVTDFQDVAIQFSQDEVKKIKDISYTVQGEFKQVESNDFAFDFSTDIDGCIMFYSKQKFIKIRDGKH